MKVRPLQPPDRDEWLRMRWALWPDHTLEQLAAEIEPYHARGTIWGLPSAAFAYHREGEPNRLGGFVEVSLRPLANGCSTSPVGYIEAWYVDPELRRCGIGGALIAAAEKWARERGCAEMASDCNADNRISYQSHLQLGYEPTEGLILFRKPLIDLEHPSRGDDWIAIVPFGLSIATAVRLVTDARVGGIDVFLGTTRAEIAPDGRELIALDYEAYEEMALEQLRQLVRRARERWPIVKLALLHRVGRVALGEPSVIIAVATPHRADAFDACRFLIDQLKVDVAIWKKEVWADGSVRWVHGGEGSGVRGRGSG